MSSQKQKELHIRLFEFYEDSNAAVATINICDVYSSALDVRKYQSFRSNTFAVFILYRPGRTATLDNYVIRVEMKGNPC